MLLGADPSADKVVADGVCQGEVVVTVGGDIAIFDDRVVDVATERLLYIGHVLNERDAADADLLASVLVGLRFGGHRQLPRLITPRTTDFDCTTPLLTDTNLSQTEHRIVPRTDQTSYPSTVGGWAGHLRIAHHR